MHPIASGKKLLTLYAEQPPENHRGPTPTKSAIELGITLM